MNRCKLQLNCALTNYQLDLQSFMQVHHHIDQLPVFHKAVITIGTFDGVHSGHRQVINLLQSEAARIGGETVVVTFHPHPRMVIAEERSSIHLLNTLEEKISLLAAHGIGHLVVVPFNTAFAQQSAAAYIEDFLVEKFHPHTIIIGYDHRFGKGRQGDYHLLEAKAAQFNYAVKEIPGQLLQNIAISSTRIREALLKADVDNANALLGYPYFFSGTVVEGNKLGRTLGYPTANLQPLEPDKLIPGNGVYAVTVVRSVKPGEILKGMMNIGTRPTVGGSKRVIEVNIFDFDQTIYSEVLSIAVHKRLRSEVKFSGLEALKAQLAADKQDAEDCLDRDQG